MNTVFLSFDLKLKIYIYIYIYICIPPLFNKKINYLKILNIQINIFEIIIHNYYYSTQVLLRVFIICFSRYFLI
jgi:hypothetical protein